MYHSTLVGQQAYRIIYVPSDAAPHPNTPYWGVDTYNKEIKLYGVKPSDHPTKEHFLRQADTQYAHRGHHDTPWQEEQARETRPANESLDHIVKEAELEQAENTRAA